MQNSSTLSQRIFGVGLLSSSSLILEIVLTRLFSALYFPPYVFLIISFAILGIGIGAALSAMLSSLRQEDKIVLYGAGASLSTLILVVFTIVAASVDIQIILFALIIIPYVFVGLALSALFSQYAESSRMLYMSDLIGAGLGAILVIPILNTFGAINGVFLAALGFSVAGFYAYAQRYMPVMVVSIGLALVAFGSNVSIEWLKLDMSTIATEKPIASVLNEGGSIIETSWDAFARTDLVDPDDGDVLRIYVDGGAASFMPRQGNNPQFVQDIGFFPFATEQPQKVFIIGPGAGLDVWFGLESGAEEIIAVEVNPASVDLVNEYRGFNGGLYTQSSVEVIVDDGRSVLERTDTTFDLIYLSQVVTLAAERGGYALSENTIYTVDAFESYLGKLSDDGQIGLKLYDEITLTRAVSTAVSALKNQGLSDEEAMQHLLILLDQNSATPTPLLLVSKSPFTEDDSLVLGTIARDIGFTPMYLPQVYVQPPLDDVADGTKSFDEIVTTSDVNIVAPTDNQPYFFQFEYGIPTTLVPLAILAAVITIAGIILFVLTWVKTSNSVVRMMPVYFAMLGLGFITIEVYVIQQTRLFLGHPTFAVTLVLATFLLGGGIGSGLSQRYVKQQLSNTSYRLTAVIVVLFVLWNIIWGLFSTQLFANTLPVRSIFVVITLLPLAICMGIPFPFGLRVVDQSSNQLVAVAWSVNGIAGVVGTVAAVVFSIISGFQTIAIIGGIAYLVATGVLFLLRSHDIL